MQAAAVSLLGLLGISLIGQQMGAQATEAPSRALRPGLMRMLPGATAMPRPAILPPTDAAGPPSETLAIQDEVRPDANLQQNVAMEGIAEEGEETARASGATQPTESVEDVAEDLRRMREEKKGLEASPVNKRPAAAAVAGKAKAKKRPNPSVQQAAEPRKRAASAKAAAEKAASLRRPAASVGLKKKTTEKPQLQLGCRRCRGSRNGCQQCRNKSYGGQRMDRAQWLKLAKKEGLKWAGVYI